MRLGILGKKIGMTQLFTEEGKFIPVTVIEAGPCVVLDVKDKKVLMGYGSKKEKNTSKSEMGLYKKAKTVPKALVKEIYFDIDDNVSVGQEISVDIFQENDFVDIIGRSIGKGFQGGVRRWHWRGGPDGHGSMHHRRVGSIGGSSYPSRIWKGQRFPGRMGNQKKTVQNLKIVKICKDKNLILVKGPVPGSKNGYLEIRIAKKRQAAPRIKKENKEPSSKEQKAVDKNG